MNRPQRAIKAPTRLIEEDVPKVVKKAVLDKPKTTTRKTKDGVKTTLHLDLSDVPKSDDRKMRSDWALDPWWQKHFYTPDDYITKLYTKAVDKFNNNLPANFKLLDAEGAIGVANLELKDEYKKPIKNIPLFSKLQKGDYQIASSKSDNNIADTIKFFRNNLPSFKKYKTTDDLSWVIKEHRLLSAELIDYYGNSATQRVATLKGRFNAITRIFRIAYETKFYDLYEKYSSVVIFLGQYFEDDEFNNELSEIEFKKFITFDVVLEKQKQLKKQFEDIENKNTAKAYDLNQDLLLVSLYSLIPPLRNEIKHLQFSKVVQREDDWIVIKPDEVLMDLNKEKKRHEGILFNLTEDAPELANILRESYELYPRQYVFTLLKKYPDVSSKASAQSLDERITKMFAFTGKSVSVNTFRSSYVSYVNSEAIKNGRQLTVKEKEKIAYRMRTSRKYLDEAYLKIFPIAKEELRSSDAPTRTIIPEPEADVEQLPAYSRQLLRNKRYYDANKEKILAKQKEYKDSKSLYEKSRVRLLHFLNNDASYYSRMKDATKQKYNFKNENGRWV